MAPSHPVYGVYGRHRTPSSDPLGRHRALSHPHGPPSDPLGRHRTLSGAIGPPRAPGGRREAGSPRAIRVSVVG